MPKKITTNQYDQLSNNSIDLLLWRNQRTFAFQPFPANYSMQICNTINSSMPETAVINNTANLASTSTNNNNGLVVDKIKSNNFAINDDSNGIKDSTKKSARDPFSHRIIEKRRRDRMNKCLNDLSKLIPQQYIKKGRGRIEKTEIVEMAIKYIKNLSEKVSKNNSFIHTENSVKNSSFGSLIDSSKFNNISSQPPYKLIKNHFQEEINEQEDFNIKNSSKANNEKTFSDDYLNGFRNCYEEMINFLNHKDNYTTNKQFIIDLESFFQKKFSQNLNNELKRKDKSFFKFNSIDGLQIMLKEIDVEKSSDKINDKLKDDSINFYNNSNLSDKTDNFLFKQQNNTLRNILTTSQSEFNSSNNKNCFSLNPTIKSRSLTSSPNSTNLDSTYKFKSLIKNRFDAEFNSQMRKSEELITDNKLSRPRSATIGSNASSLRMINSSDFKEKIIHSNNDLNALSNVLSLKQNDIKNLKNLNYNTNDIQLNQKAENNLNIRNSPLIKEQISKDNDVNFLFRKPSPGFVLYPDRSYYVPIQIDLSNLITHFKPDSFYSTSEEKFLDFTNHNHCLSITNSQGGQNTFDKFQDNHFSSKSTSPSFDLFNSIKNSPFSTINLIQKNSASLKSSLEDKQEKDNILYPISISVDFNFPPLPLNALPLNLQKPC